MLPQQPPAAVVVTAALVDRLGRGAFFGESGVVSGLAPGGFGLLPQVVGFSPFFFCELLVGLGLLLKTGELGEQALGLCTRIARFGAPRLGTVGIELRLVALALGPLGGPDDGPLKDAVDAPLDPGGGVLD